MKSIKVDPNQNVSPTQSTHIGSDQRFTGASISEGGGCPLRLSLAAGLLGHIIATSEGKILDLSVRVNSAFAAADALIAKYNESVA